MLRQYCPPRFRYAQIRGRNLIIGTVDIGTIYSYRPPRAGRAQRYMVMAWLPRAYSRVDRSSRRTDFSYLARGGHLALVTESGKRADGDYGGSPHPSLRR
jgi:hypothetical protein